MKLPTQLIVWCNAEVSHEARALLVSGLDGHRLLWDDQETSNLASAGPSSLLAQADIAFGQPDPPQITELPNLRWVHLTSAGYTRYDRDDVRAALAARGATLSNSSSVYDEPCAQHLLAFMLAQARQLPQAMAAQVRGEGWVYERLRPTARVLSDQSVLILGYGAIARRLVALLEPFDLRVTAIRRTVKGDEAVQVYSMDELDGLLPTADHVVDALPASPSTEGVMNEERFALMKREAAFYNIGRGTTVDHEALLGALKSARLSCAYLDVTDPEPLPPDHPLWTAPNCFITPHIGGGMQNEASALVRHFLANLRRFETGQPLVDKVI